jgi:predicted enzyme related to lactoylglutathione lyase
MSAKQERRRNRVVWFEIPANDLARATRFYETILATSLRAETMGDHELRIFSHADDATGGCLLKAPGFEPNKGGGVLAYLNADPSLDAVLARVERAGGKVAVPRTGLPGDMGSFAHIIDSEGNRVGLHALE